MDNAPAEAPAPAPAGESEQTPTTNTEPAQAPEVNAEQVAKYFGTDAETLSKFQKFVEANGKFDSAFSKMKTNISNPEKPAEAPAEPQKTEPTSQPKEEPTYKVPQGAITPSEFLAEQYFKSLAGEDKYKTISEGIRNGEYLKEMAAFGIQALNQDGSINDQKVRMYLDLKAQTVPAKPTETEPNASNAPTVTYTAAGDQISSIDQAYKIIMEPGNPDMDKAEEFIKNSFNPDSQKKK